MHYRKKPFGLNRAYAFAAAAKAEGAELLYFSPGAIDRDRINGYMYKNGEWALTSSHYPDVIYNTAGFTREKQLEAVEKLQQSVPFTSYSIGDKETVYNNLMKYKTFSQYLVPSETVASKKHFFRLLDQYSDIVVKPSSGRQGINVCRVRKEDGTPDAVLRLIAEEKCIVQPYINCRTKSGEPYDFRLHVQKGRGGKWTAPCIYPRISPDGGIVCNLSRGGYTRDIIPFLQREFGAEYYSVHKYLEVFSLQLAGHLDEIQKDLYGEELDELGIDAGLDKQLYVYEVNWRPGHPPSGNINLSIVRNTVRYAIFLAGKEGIMNEKHSVSRFP
ncbi:MAG: YheC/YheD family protein [Oscillospiraceae bacterium]|jgi:UDP-N-acetylmuramoyl-tripeptide--D-alanyl-D-alanine ligase|nr:YheC/YheD family protein [Oscillospiraceae bacterium]